MDYSAAGDFHVRIVAGKSYGTKKACRGNGRLISNQDQVSELEIGHIRDRNAVARPGKLESGAISINGHVRDSGDREVRLPRTLHYITHSRHSRDNMVAPDHDRASGADMGEPIGDCLPRMVGASQDGGRIVAVRVDVDRAGIREPGIVGCGYEAQGVGDARKTVGDGRETEGVLFGAGIDSRPEGQVCR
jgi:hypothetical protein